MKLISGKMNVPYLVCKPGYATGVIKPKREAKVTAKESTIIKIRRQEGLVA